MQSGGTGDADLNVLRTNAISAGYSTDDVTVVYMDDAQAAQLVAAQMPVKTVVDGLVFLNRVNDTEYAAITAAGRSNAQIGRWIDMLRLLGSIDVNGTTAIQAKAGLVAAGLLTQERADIIFAP